METDLMNQLVSLLLPGCGDLELATLAMDIPKQETISFRGQDNQDRF